MEVDGVAITDGSRMVLEAAVTLKLDSRAEGKTATGAADETCMHAVTTVAAGGIGRRRHHTTIGPHRSTIINPHHHLPPTPTPL